MFCYQCEQTGRGTGCTVQGVCGKDETTATLLDLLVHATKGIAQYAHRAAQLGARDPQVDVFVLEALFTTVTNVDFDPERIDLLLVEAGTILNRARNLYATACTSKGIRPETLNGPAAWALPTDHSGRLAQGRSVGIQLRLDAKGTTLTGLQELVLYGLKGAAAYAHHAMVLGKTDPALFAGFHDHLDHLTQEPTVDALLGRALAVGALNLRAMELLDAANTGTYGHPEPTRVRVTPIKGKAIVVTGHDLRDLELLLQQTAGKGINVYTHGEMLPCLAYPGLKKYPHLVGNYGGAWQDQQKEFDQFPGAILFTTNCIQKPRETYKARVFTTGLVGWPGVAHIGANKDFSPVIAAALAAPGFATNDPEQFITIGFARQTVLSVAGTVIDAVKTGALKHFFLIGGCDGAKPGRNYYTDLAEQVPKDCVILTLACGKFRFNKKDLGTIGGLPRLLDMGQCNDAYSAIQVALALAKTFNCGVNDLPLSLICSWYEQKAVAILLTLLHLGIRNVRLGPSLPAFVTPQVLQVLVDKFAIKPISTPADDLRDILQPA